MPSCLRILLSGLLLFNTTCLVAAGYPATLAHEVPLYPQARLDSASEDGRTASAVLNTGSPVDQAVRYYIDQLTGKGWTQTASAAAGRMQALEFSRDRSSIAISIMPTTAGTTIALTLHRQ